MARTARKVTRKSAGVEKTPAVEETSYPAKVVTIRIDFIVSTGRDDARSLDELKQQIKELLLEQAPVKNVTPISGYYIITHGNNKGKVCLPDDYDPVTQDFKPGKYPPTWAGGPDEKEILERIRQEKALDSLSRNPAHLRTAKETKRFHEMNGGHKGRTPAEALDDFYANTERGREIVAERERAMEEGRKGSRASAFVTEDGSETECENCGLAFEDCLCELDADDCQDCGLEMSECACNEVAEDDEADDEYEEEDEVDVEDINDDAKMSAALAEVEANAMARFRTGRKVVRKR